MASPPAFEVEDMATCRRWVDIKAAWVNKIVSDSSKGFISSTRRKASDDDDDSHDDEDRCRNPLVAGKEREVDPEVDRFVDDTGYDGSSELEGDTFSRKRKKSDQAGAASRKKSKRSKTPKTPRNPKNRKTKPKADKLPPQMDIYKEAYVTTKTDEFFNTIRRVPEALFN